MDEFRKPRADYPILPSTAMYRPRTKGLKRIKGRRGLKPKGKRTKFKGYQDPMFRNIKAKDEKRKERERALEEIKEKKETATENLRLRREQLRIEDRAQQDTTRHRTAQLTAQTARDLRDQANADRQAQELQRLYQHFQVLYQEQERRSGQLQTLFQDQIIQLGNRSGQDVREIGDKLTQIGAEVRMLTPRTARRSAFVSGGAEGGGSVRATEPLLQEVEEEEEEVGTPRQPIGVSVEAERERERTAGAPSVRRPPQRPRATPERDIVPSEAEQVEFDTLISKATQPKPPAKKLSPSKDDPMRARGGATPREIMEGTPRGGVAPVITAEEIIARTRSAQSPIKKAQRILEEQTQALEEELEAVSPKTPRRTTTAEAEEARRALKQTLSQPTPTRPPLTPAPEPEPAPVAQIEELDAYEALFDLRQSGKKTTFSAKVKGGDREWTTDERFGFRMGGKSFQVMGIDADTRAGQRLSYRDPEAKDTETKKGLDAGWSTMLLTKFEGDVEEGDIEVFKEGSEEEDV